MFEHILEEIQDKVRHLRYVMTAHADDEADNDDLSVFDVEQGILTGAIVERQRNLERDSWKYLVEGKTLAGDGIAVVVELGPTGKAVIITVFLLDEDRNGL